MLRHAAIWSGDRPTDVMALFDVKLFFGGLLLAALHQKVIDFADAGGDARSPTLMTFTSINTQQQQQFGWIGGVHTCHVSDMLMN